jgi:hypothetical protein
MPEYGMGFDVHPDEIPTVVDPFVETKDWTVSPLAIEAAREPIQFVDGVRRIELRLIGDADGVRFPGLFGTYAVGNALCADVATFGESIVGRSLVLGGGQSAPSIELAFGDAVFTFASTSTAGAEPDDPLLKLQALMRDAEAQLAARLADVDDTLILVDGPLAFFNQTLGPVVGVVKRFGRVYLAPEHGALIPKLDAGRRTPLFAIEEEKDKRRRYAWYTRLAPTQPPWHDHAGVVRCELRGGLPISEAIAIADRVSARLPDYAGRPSDPRTPQNLAPIAALETWLRHRLGDTRLIRRGLLDWITTEAKAA